MTVLTLERKAEISIDTEIYYMLHELARQENCTPEEFVEYLIYNHPDAHDIQIQDKVIWICTCGWRTKYIEEVREHLESYPDHSCTKCLEF